MMTLRAFRAAGRRNTSGRKQNRTTERTAVVLAPPASSVRTDRAPRANAGLWPGYRTDAARTGLQVPRLIEAPARFDALDDLLAPLLRHPTVDAYCCLGTTIRAAGSQQAFRRVDHDLVLAFARWAAGVPVSRLVVVSALGADAKSRVFYNCVKGETEDALRAVAGSSLVLLRPSLLDGPRTERRWGESLALTMTRRCEPGCRHRCGPSLLRMSRSR